MPRSTLPVLLLEWTWHYIGIFLLLRTFFLVLDCALGGVLAFEGLVSGLGGRPVVVHRLGRHIVGTTGPFETKRNRGQFDRADLADQVQMAGSRTKPSSRRRWRSRGVDIKI